jgi:hypothetical protein
LAFGPVSNNKIVNELEISFLTKFNIKKFLEVVIDLDVVINLQEPNCFELPPISFDLLSILYLNKTKTERKVLRRKPQN